MFVERCRADGCLLRCTGGKGGVIEVQVGSEFVWDAGVWGARVWVHGYRVQWRGCTCMGCNDVDARYGVQLCVFERVWGAMVWVHARCVKVGDGLNSVVS